VTEPPEYPPPTPYAPQPPVQQPPQAGPWQPPPPPPPPPWQGWQQPGWQPQPPPTPTGTNSLAVGALVTSILGTLCLSSIVLAIVALVQTSKTGQKGRGMAIVSLVISGLWVIGGITLVAVDAANSEHENHDTAAAIAESEDVSTLDIAVGDCLITAQLDEDSAVLINTLPKVPCSKRHDTEVYAVIQATGTDYPGDDEMGDIADDLCSDAFDERLPRDVADDWDYGTFYLYPSAETWAGDDRDVTCMVTTDDLRTGSVR